MNNDLADRLLNVAEKHGLMYTDIETIEEAASALRSSGEAELRGLRYVRDYIATSGQDYGIGSYRPNGSGFARNFSNRDDLLCCIDRQIEKLSATPASAWRPIEEAPRDGRYVLLVHESSGGRPYAGMWCYDDKQWVDERGCIRVPTHFQPLPTPPTSTSQPAASAALERV